MDKPVYEIPDMSGDDDVFGWTPRRIEPPAAPVASAAPIEPAAPSAPATSAASSGPEAPAGLAAAGSRRAARLAEQAAGVVAGVVARPSTPEPDPAPRLEAAASVPVVEERAALLETIRASALPYALPIPTVEETTVQNDEAASLPEPPGYAEWPAIPAYVTEAVAQVTRPQPQLPPEPQLQPEPSAPQEPVVAAAPAPASPAQPGRQVADAGLIAALQEVVASGASDLHVTANAAPTLRVDGGLRPAPGTEVWDRDRVKRALYSLLTAQQREHFEHELELDFAYTLSANARFRVNLYQQRDAIGAAFRLIPTEIRTLKALGVPADVGHFAGLPRGLVLVTGPTGSGKSTTLAALIDLVNETRTDHIVTVEDPIEFLHNHKKAIINQREVGHDTHSFANALKHVLRQDPDVILVGELRDLETISVALTAAETGHLVFATLHTQDAAQTIDRVIDVFPPHQQDQVRVQLASTLQGVVCQTLIRKASGEGRVVATEVLVTTPAVANLIREGKTYQIASAMQAGRDLGMHTMDQHLAELVNSGRITREAALEKSHDPAGFDRLIHRVETTRDATSRALQTAGPDFGDAFSRTVQ